MSMATVTSVTASVLYLVKNKNVSISGMSICNGANKENLEFELAQM